MRKLLRSLFKKKNPKKVESKDLNTSEVAFSGFNDNRLKIPFVDHLNDEDLIELNSLLNWHAFVADDKGRRFGDLAWKGKRQEPQVIPDYRHNLLDSRVPLQGKKVLEIGCFEGIHTISLCRLAKEVVAIDSRIENVVKTLIRCNFFNEKPTVFKCDIEVWDAPKEWLQADVCHHIGVLYHLKDPVSHLRVLATLIKDAILLDTHVAVKTDQLDEYTVEGKTFKYKKYLESGKKDVFSGMYDHAKWLLLDDIKAILSECGFSRLDLIEERAERNGPRVLLLAQR